MKQAKQILRGAVNSAIPTLGICFGHQLLADTLGGSVIRSDHRTDAIYNLELSDIGLNDPLFDGLLNDGSGPIALYTHQDHVVEISTDKVDSDVPSEVSGILLEKKFETDAVVEVGQTFAVIETDQNISIAAAESNFEKENLKAFGSSGFGEGSVGKSPLGTICSETVFNRSKFLNSRSFGTILPPVPWNGE